MNLSISGHHVEVTPALREYVTTKLRRIRHHFDQVIDVNVILSVEKLVQRAEMKLLVAGREIFAEATHTDLYAAVDTLIDKLDRQVIKHKQKRQNYSGSALKRIPRTPPEQALRHGSAPVDACRFHPGAPLARPGCTAPSPLQHLSPAPSRKQRKPLNPNGNRLHAHPFPHHGGRRTPQGRTRPGCPHPAKPPIMTASRDRLPPVRPCANHCKVLSQSRCTRYR